MTQTLLPSRSSITLKLRSLTLTLVVFASAFTADASRGSCNSETLPSENIHGGCRTCFTASKGDRARPKGSWPKWASCVPWMWPEFMYWWFGQMYSHTCRCVPLFLCGVSADCLCSACLGMLKIMGCFGVVGAPKDHCGKTLAASGPPRLGVTQIDTEMPKRTLRQRFHDKTFKRRKKRTTMVAEDRKQHDMDPPFDDDIFWVGCSNNSGVHSSGRKTKTRAPPFGLPPTKQRLSGFEPATLRLLNPSDLQTSGLPSTGPAKIGRNTGRFGLPKFGQNE